MSYLEYITLVGLRVTLVTVLMIYVCVYTYMAELFRE